MIRNFLNKGSENIFNGKNTKKARKLLPLALWAVATRKLDQLDSVSILNDLKVPPGNMLEPLSGNRKGQFSIRINEQYRICFKWDKTEPVDVEITDYH
jgi:proteic killer suppression protein